MADGLARSGFDIDLRQGQAWEDAFVHLFLRSRVEVKSDHKAAATGNVFVEYRQPSGPSGIAVTQAEWWAFMLVGLGWVIVPTSRLRQLAAAAYRSGKRVRGGDGNRYEGVLVPVDWLVRPWRPV